MLIEPVYISLSHGLILFAIKIGCKSNTFLLFRRYKSIHIPPLLDFIAVMAWYSISLACLGGSFCVLATEGYLQHFLTEDFLRDLRVALESERAAFDLYCLLLSPNSDAAVLKFTMGFFVDSSDILEPSWDFYPQYFFFLLCPIYTFRIRLFVFFSSFAAWFLSFFV